MDNLNSFTSSFEGGARAYLFEIIDLGSYIKKTNFKYFVKSTSLPGESINEIPVNWLGAEYKYAAGLRFNDWTISFNIDRDFDLITQFQNWRKGIVKIDGPLGNIDYGISSKYVKQIQFKLLKYGLPDIAGTSDSGKYMTLYDAWPKSIGDSVLDYGSQEIMTFDVTFNYAWHRFGSE